VPKGFQGDPWYCGGAVRQGAAVNVAERAGLGQTWDGSSSPSERGEKHETSRGTGETPSTWGSVGRGQDFSSWPNATI